MCKYFAKYRAFIFKMQWYLGSLKEFESYSINVWDILSLLLQLGSSIKSARHGKTET